MYIYIPTCRSQRINSGDNTYNIFRDRAHAGTLLANKCLQLGIANSPSHPCICIGLPRGGLPVAAQVATALHCPLDIILCKKIGFPGHEEFAIGAVSARGALYLDEQTIARYQIASSYISQQQNKLSKLCMDRERQYRSHLPPLNLHNKTVVIADDGIATGATMLCAIDDVSKMHPFQIIVATPVVAQDTLQKLERHPAVRRVVFCLAPKQFGAVGRFYQTFNQIEDDEAMAYIK